MYINKLNDINKLPDIVYKLRGKVNHHSNNYRILEARENKNKSNLIVAVIAIVCSLGLVLAIPKFRKFVDSALHGKKITHYLHAELIPTTLSFTRITPTQLMHLIQGTPTSTPVKPIEETVPSDVPEQLQADRAIWMAVATEDPELPLKKDKFPTIWLKDAEFMKEACIQNKEFFELFVDFNGKNAPQALLQDKEFWLKMADNYAGTLAAVEFLKFPARWRGDSEFMKEVIFNKNLGFFYGATKELTQDIAFCKEVLASDKFKETKNNPAWDIYQHLPEELRKDKELAKKAISYRDSLGFHLPQGLKVDEEFMLEMISNYPTLIRATPLQNNIEFCKKAVSRNHEIFNWLKDSMKADTGIVQIAIKKHRFPLASEWAPKAYNKEFALDIVLSDRPVHPQRKEGDYLLFALPEPYRHDRDVIFTAICMNPLILKFLSKEEKALLHQHSDDLANAIAAYDAPNPEAKNKNQLYKTGWFERGELLRFLEQNGINLELFYTKILEKNGMAFFGLPEIYRQNDNNVINLQKNAILLAVAIRQNSRVWDFLDQDYKEVPEIKRLN